jgi:dipeptidyl-peptidase-4
LFKTEKGNELNAWIMKPKDFDASNIGIYVSILRTRFSASSQSMEFNDYWFMMPQQGYIVACVDGRGTGFKGADFKKVSIRIRKVRSGGSNRCCKVIGNYAFVDKTRIGIFGWSYGGLWPNMPFKGNTLKWLLLAPVTNWRFYDSIYTERYMQTPRKTQVVMMKTHLLIM